jgi:hypothetical protein
MSELEMDCCLMGMCEIVEGAPEDGRAELPALQDFRYQKLGIEHGLIRRHG